MNLVKFAFLAGVVWATTAYAGSLSLLPDGPLSAAGNQIVDGEGHPIRILAVGTWTDVSNKMPLIVEAGFNTIRMDWSNRALHQDDRLRLLDKVVASARRNGLKVILDDHSDEAAAGMPWKFCFAQQLNGIWYDSGGATDGTDGCNDHGTVTDAQFVEDWQAVARHFKGNDTVIGYDLWNEPLNQPNKATWEAGSNNPGHNIRFMYERVGNAILAIDPAKLIICEGPLSWHGSYANPEWTAAWGDLSLAGRLPVNLTIAHKLVYSVHDYPSSIGGNAVPDHGPAKIDLMNHTYGYLVVQNVAPVWIGEMGANMTTPADQAWADTIVAYANGKLGAAGGPVFSAGQQGLGIDWWFAGYDPHGAPTGIFNAVGGINERQHETYEQFFTYRRVAE